MFIPKTKQEVEVDAKIETTDAKERLLDKLAQLAERSGEE
jgi:hypothetical protein